MFSNTRSLGKSSFINTISKIVLSFKHCLADNGQQEDFDVDATEDDVYKAYIVDGINDAQSFDFSVIENICDQIVSLKKRNNTAGKLQKGTPFIMSSNQNHVQLFGPVNGNNLRARAMILDLRNIVLFPVIDEIIRVHNLEPYVENDLIIPEDLINMGWNDNLQYKCYPNEYTKKLIL